MLLVFGIKIYSQVPYTIEGTATVNTDAEFPTIDIPRSVPTTLTFKNNSITARADNHYLVMAGDDSWLSTHNNLDGAIITGNRLIWTGYNDFPGSTLHGIMLGYNKNYVVKYNYFDGVPNPIPIKGGHATIPEIWTDGVVAYNIFKNQKMFSIKGVSNVRVYNNVFYNDRNRWNECISIWDNVDPDQATPYPAATGTKIKNCIFWQYEDAPAIITTSTCLVNFECDYNIYYVDYVAEGGHNPRFQIDGGWVSWEQWRARGYDAHSIVINPDFINTTDFVPATRLDFGTNLGSEFETGLSVDAVWSTIDPNTSLQNGPWQAGARIYEGSSNPGPVYVSSSVENATPSVLEMNYNVSLANIVPAASAFSVMVNSVVRTVSTVAISGTKVLLTLASPIADGNSVTVAYTKPAVDMNIKDFQIHTSHLNGSYIIQLGLENSIIFTQKLIILSSN